MVSVFLLLIAFQIKHFLADYPLQRPYMLRKFLPYPHYVLPLLCHASVHGLMTFMICGAYTLNIPLSLGLGILDLMIHFGMDRIKASPNLWGKFKALSAFEFMALSSEPKLKIVFTPDRGGFSETKTTLKNFSGKPAFGFKEVDEKEAKTLLKGNTYFWWALGADQMVHHLTHYWIIWTLICYTNY